MGLKEVKDRLIELQVSLADSANLSEDEKDNLSSEIDNLAKEYRRLSANVAEKKEKQEKREIREDGTKVYICGICGGSGHNARKCPAKNGEVKNLNKCGICGEFGHNSRSCKNSPESEEKMKAMLIRKMELARAARDKAALMEKEAAEKLSSLS